jgi:hypothetical protein
MTFAQLFSVCLKASAGRQLSLKGARKTADFVLAHFKDTTTSAERLAHQLWMETNDRWDAASGEMVIDARACVR